MPKFLHHRLGLKERAASVYSNGIAAVMGALTFFLPCGFTQAMQLYAMSTGNPLRGGLIMGTFALGTAPGILGVGGLSSFIKGPASKIFFKTVGVLVLVFALFNINNGINLIGIKPLVAKAVIADPNVQIVNGIQEVRMRQVANGYLPNSFTIKKNVPVRWIITSESSSCASSIVSQSLGIRRGLNLGENIIEFTPNETGTIRFSCSMGMYTGTFIVE